MDHVVAAPVFFVEQRYTSRGDVWILWGLIQPDPSQKVELSVGHGYMFLRVGCP